MAAVIATSPRPSYRGSEHLRLTNLHDLGNYRVEELLDLKLKPDYQSLRLRNGIITTVICVIAIVCLTQCSANNFSSVAIDV